MLPRLPILVTLISAYAAVFTNLGAIIKATFLPLMIAIVLSAINVEMGDSLVVRVVTVLLGLPVAATIAVAIHRIVLLGPDSLTNPWSLSWTARETSFLVWLVTLGVCFFLASLAFSLVLWMLPEAWMMVLAAFLFGFWVEGRFGMVLPATALDRPMHLSPSWFLTSGNDLQLIVVLGLPVLILVGLIKAALWVESPLLVALVWALGTLLTLAVQIAVLSLSYRFLFEEAREA
jgi:hypothetical protein